MCIGRGQCYPYILLKFTFQLCFQIRDIRHDNINPFIGACIDGPDILVVSAYCAKGSLQVGRQPVATVWERAAHSVFVF